MFLIVVAIASLLYINHQANLTLNFVEYIALNDECEIIQLNQKFDCIAKNKELSNYLKTLLES